MNTKETSVTPNMIRHAKFALLLACVAIAAPCAAQSQEKFFYWMAPGTEPDSPWGRERHREEGFVVEVSATVATEIERQRSKGFTVGIEGTVRAGAVSYNRNYFLPGHPTWNWHLVDVITGSLYQPPTHEGRDYVANPSEIERDIAFWHGKTYRPQFYVVTARIYAQRPDALANVSNRGVTGAGEKALITGFIITGGEPRNVVVRAIGPSLAAQGVQQPVLNPKIDVYRGETLVASNDDWKTDHRATSLRQNYEALAPTNDKEAALLLTLLPGAYTLHGLSAAGGEGIVLVEAYDVDSNAN